MDVFDEIMLAHYFSLSKVCYSLKRYKREVQQEFYGQNMATHTEYSELGIFTKGFRPDREVEKYLLCLELIDKRINRNQYRLKQFKRFLQNLPLTDLTALKAKYIDQKDIVLSEALYTSAVNEVYEIETAICFREGMEPERERIELTKDDDENLERLCDFFAI